MGKPLVKKFQPVRPMGSRVMSKNAKMKDKIITFVVSRFTKQNELEISQCARIAALTAHPIAAALSSYQAHVRAVPKQTARPCLCSVYKESASAP